MIEALVIFIISQCSNPVIINHTPDWTKRDNTILNSAQLRCMNLYTDAPCVKKFIKKDEYVYNVICGGVDE